MYQKSRMVACMLPLTTTNDGVGLLSCAGWGLAAPVFGNLGNYVELISIRTSYHRFARFGFVRGTFGLPKRSGMKQRQTLTAVGHAKPRAAVDSTAQVGVTASKGLHRRNLHRGGLFRWNPKWR